MLLDDTEADVFMTATSEHGTQPGGWTRTEGAGRVCMLTPGHNVEVWLHPSYQVCWAMPCVGAPRGRSKGASHPMDAFILDEQGDALLERHAAWWQRKGSLISVTQSTPLGDLWLPLADGTLAAEDLDVTPDMLDLDRLAGPPQEPAR